MKGSKIFSMLVFLMLLPFCLQGLAQAKQKIGETRAVNIETPHPYENGGSPNTLVWSYTLSHPGAGHIKIHFKNFSVVGTNEDGDYVLLKDKDGNLAQRLSGLDIGDRWAISVTGDAVIIELYADEEQTAYGFDIDRYAFAYGTLESPVLEGPKEEKSVLSFPEALDSEGFVAESIQGEEKGGKRIRIWPQRICGNNDLNSVCDAEEQERIRLSDAVGRIELVDDCGFLIGCTGFLFKEDGSFMTAAHCVNSPTEAESAEVLFNNTEASCSREGKPNPDVYPCKELLKTSCKLDYAVLSLDLSLKDNPAEVYGWLPLSEDRPLKGEPVWVPQQPGDFPGLRRISEIDAAVISPRVGGANCCDDPCCSKEFCTNTGIKSEFTHSADTIGGSSGSPVISVETNKVVGLHHATAGENFEDCNAREGANFAVLSTRIIADMNREHCTDHAIFRVLEAWNDGTITEDKFNFFGSVGSRFLTSELFSEGIFSDIGFMSKFVSPNRFEAVYKCHLDPFDPDTPLCKSVIRGRVLISASGECYGIIGSMTISKGCELESLGRRAAFIGIKEESD